MAEERDQSARIQKLEESQGFSERAIEELAAEVRELGKRVLDLGGKLARLEAGLESKKQDEGEGAPAESSQE